MSNSDDDYDHYWDIDIDEDEDEDEEESDSTPPKKPTRAELRIEKAKQKKQQEQWKKERIASVDKNLAELRKVLLREQAAIQSTEIKRHYQQYGFLNGRSESFPTGMTIILHCGAMAMASASKSKRRPAKPKPKK